jgi:hypothetical protein
LLGLIVVVNSCVEGPWGRLVIASFFSQFVHLTFSISMRARTIRDPAAVLYSHAMSPKAILKPEPYNGLAIRLALRLFSIKK